MDPTGGGEPYQISSFSLWTMDNHGSILPTLKTWCCKEMQRALNFHLLQSKRQRCCIQNLGLDEWLHLLQTNSRNQVQRLHFSSYESFLQVLEKHLIINLFLLLLLIIITWSSHHPHIPSSYPILTSSSPPSRVLHGLKHAKSPPSP